MNLSLQPIVFFGEAQGLACESPVLMAHRAVLSLYKCSIEMPVDGRALQIGLKHLLSAKDHLLTDTSYPTFFPVLDYLGIQ
jgi:hypothetical protein